MKESLDQYVIAQDEAKKILSVAVYNHYKRVKASPVPVANLNPQPDPIAEGRSPSASEGYYPLTDATIHKSTKKLAQLFL